MDTGTEKLNEILEEYENLRQSFLKIKRLMPEVEAELLSKMSGVGAAPERKMTPEEIELKARIRKHFYRTTKIK